MNKNLAELKVVITYSQMNEPLKIRVKISLTDLIIIEYF